MVNSANHKKSKCSIQCLLILTERVKSPIVFHMLK